MRGRGGWLLAVLPFMLVDMSKPHARTIEAGKKQMAERYPDKDTPEHERLIAKVDARHRALAIADQIAESAVWFRNWKYPGADKLYPLDPYMRFVDKYYPYAKGGPLLVDEPATELEYRKSLEKQVVLKRAGFRHIVIRMLPATSLYEAREQLGEV